MKKERQIFALLIGLMLVVTVALLWMGRTTTAPPFETKNLRRDTLDTERQIIDVQADSLLGLIKRLHQRHSAVFSYSPDKTELMIRCEKGQESAFNRLFLNDATLSSYAKVQQTQMEIDLKANKFTLPLITQRKQRYATIPAEILQSMLLSLED